MRKTDSNRLAIVVLLVTGAIIAGHTFLSHSLPAHEPEAAMAPQLPRDQWSKQVAGSLKVNPKPRGQPVVVTTSTVTATTTTTTTTPLVWKPMAIGWQDTQLVRPATGQKNLSTA